MEGKITGDEEMTSEAEEEGEDEEMGRSLESRSREIRTQGSLSLIYVLIFCLRFRDHIPGCRARISLSLSAAADAAFSAKGRRRRRRWARE